MADLKAKQWTTKLLDAKDATLTVRVAEDEKGQPVNIHVSMGAPGNPLAIAMDSVCGAVNVGLAKGIPISVYTKGLKAQKFSPDGPTDDPLVPKCASVVDYLFKALEARYPNG